MKKFLFLMDGLFLQIHHLAPIDHAIYDIWLIGCENFKKIFFS